MATPTVETVEERIIANVQATLAAISPASPAADFWTTVKRVFRFDRDPMAVAVGEVPAVSMIYEACTPADGPTGVHAYELALQLYLCMAKQNDNWKRDLGRFAADVQRALRVDAGRGVFNDNANAFDSHVSEVRSTNAPEESPVVMARIDLLIQYRHLVNDPTTAA